MGMDPSVRYESSKKSGTGTLKKKLLNYFFYLNYFLVKNDTKSMKNTNLK